jgi:uncharacterized protein
MLQSFLIRVVDFCVRHAAAVIVAAALLVGASGVYAARHFAIDTNINDMFSKQLSWRQNELQFRAAFPQINDFILAVIEAPTAEASEGATRALISALAARPDVFQSVEEAGGGDFFRKNGLLFLPLDNVKRTTALFTQAAPIIGALARDPSLRGSIQALSLGLAGVSDGYLTLDSMTRPLTLAAITLEDVEKSRPAEFSWKGLTQEQAQPRDLRHLVEIRPALDLSQLQPGKKATEALRAIVNDLGLAAKYRATVHLTGPVPISDAEYASLSDGTALNGAVTGLLVIGILWLALRSWRLVAAVAVTLACGLAVTAAIGILIVGPLNPISIAFAILFVGLGADFAVQFSVRYRAQRHETNQVASALGQAANCVGIPITLAAGGAAVGFLSFLPTDYTGLAQLGIIASCGMVVAYVESLTLLPALIRIAKPPHEPKPLTMPALAGADHFLRRHRILVVTATAMVVIAGLPSLTRLQFDFNPLDLRDRSSEPIATMLQLGKEGIANTAEVLVPSEAGIGDVESRLRALPEVADVRTINSFIPADQAPKLAAIRSADQTLAPSLRAPQRPAPTDADIVAALMRGAQSLENAADEKSGPGADAAQRLAADMSRLAQADAMMRERAAVAFVRPLQTALDDLRALLNPQEVTRESLPADLVRDWITPDGRARVEAVPKGDANNNNTIIRFARAVLQIQPDADGQAVALLEWGDAMLRAFLEAALLALCAIAVLLLLVLRRVSDMLVTLIPLVVAALGTLEICALTHFALNYANIIALPVLLGIGVAFKIYYVTAWRRGQVNFLQSALTRAIFFSTLLTAVAFGSLWLSRNPGISSMGKLLGLSLFCTLASAALFQPALMGEPRKLQPRQEDDLDTDTIGLTAALKK